MELTMHDELFHDGGPYHIETSSLICSANQWIDFYLIEASVMKELNVQQVDSLGEKSNDNNIQERC